VLRGSTLLTFSPFRSTGSTSKIATLSIFYHKEAEKKTTLPLLAISPKKSTANLNDTSVEPQIPYLKTGAAPRTEALPFIFQALRHSRSSKLRDCFRLRSPQIVAQGVGVAVKRKAFQSDVFHPGGKTPAGSKRPVNRFKEICNR